MDKKEEITGVDLKKNPTPKKRRFGLLRAAGVSLLSLTLLCGIIYPLTVTLVSQTIFPFESNGSLIKVTLKDGTERTYGSELIGQNFTEGKYLIGRVNLGAASNLAPNSEEFKKIVDDRISFLNTLGHYDSIPTELVTSSGSGIDPHISTETASYQIERIVEYRNKELAEELKIKSSDVTKIISKYTKDRFLFIFGEKTVNVLLVNLALDGLL